MGQTVFAMDANTSARTSATSTRSGSKWAGRCSGVPTCGSASPRPSTPARSTTSGLGGIRPHVAAVGTAGPSHVPLACLGPAGQRLQMQSQIVQPVHPTNGTSHTAPHRRGRPVTGAPARPQRTGPHRRGRGTRVGTCGERQCQGGQCVRAGNVRAGRRLRLPSQSLALLASVGSAEHPRAKSLFFRRTRPTAPSR